MIYTYYLIEENFKGITNDWTEVKDKTFRKQSRYKKFKNEEEARQWLDNGAMYENKPKSEDGLLFTIPKPKQQPIELDPDGVFCDSGTGRMNIPEVKVSDYLGQPLLHKVLGESNINEFGNYYLDKSKTNNYGELFALGCALRYALSNNKKNVYSDSNLVVNYWSKQIFKPQELSLDTIRLIVRVVELRQEFEALGGNVIRISGDYNPADLGFHKS